MAISSKRRQRGGLGHYLRVGYYRTDINNDGCLRPQLYRTRKASTRSLRLPTDIVWLDGRSDVLPALQRASEKTTAAQTNGTNITKK